MPTSPTVLIVGGGLTGSTVAHALARADVNSVVLEAQDRPGGLIRSEHLHGVLHEPQGSHILREALDVSDEVLAALHVNA